MDFSPQLGIGFLLGVLVTAIINHFLTKDRDRQHARQEAAQKFRTVVAREIALLANPDNRFLMSAFDNTHVALIQAAAIEFQAFLDSNKRERLTTIWTAFKQNEENRTQHSNFEKNKQRVELLRELLSLAE